MSLLSVDILVNALALQIVSLIRRTRVPINLESFYQKLFLRVAEHLEQEVRGRELQRLLGFTAKKKCRKFHRLRTEFSQTHVDRRVIFRVFRIILKNGTTGLISEDDIGKRVQGAHPETSTTEVQAAIFRLYELGLVVLGETSQGPSYMLLWHVTDSNRLFVSQYILHTMTTGDEHFSAATAASNSLLPEVEVQTLLEGLVSSGLVRRSKQDAPRYCVSTQTTIEDTVAATRMLSLSQLEAALEGPDAAHAAELLAEIDVVLAKQRHA